MSSKNAVGGSAPNDKRSLANKKHYEDLVARRSELQSAEEVIDYNEIHWAVLAAEPRGVDYIEVVADGVSAMWISPKESAQDRVIFYAHGGGFIVGSIYTHRKMVAHLAKATGCRALLFDSPILTKRNILTRSKQHSWHIAGS